MKHRDILSHVVLALLAITLSPASALSETAKDLSGRIVIDGFSGDFLPDETLLQPTYGGGPEESTVDSQWGIYNDLNNIKVTWDADYVYVAVDGYIFDNNTMIFFDTVDYGPDEPGLTSLSQVNSWRRAVSFDNGIFPDLFLATWDRNTTPQLWFYTGPNQVAQVPQGTFPTVATFSRDLPGRSMEAAIPWDVFFQGVGVREFNPAYNDTVYQLPSPGAEVRIVAWITTGADGLGGPDSAPDNLSGHQVDSAVPVVLDNYIRLQLDRYDYKGDPEPDGVPDFNVPVRIPTSDFASEEDYRKYVSGDAEEPGFFFVAPPVRGVTLQIAELDIGPKAIAPDYGDEMRFRFTVTPRIDDPRLRAARTLNFTAEIFDLKGLRVRTLYRELPFTLDTLDSTDIPAPNRFDGRDDEGRLLEGGIYILRVVLEPGQDEIEAAMAVVR